MKAHFGFIEKAEFGAFNKLITSLKQKKEGNGSLLDNSMVLFGSNLGNANSHDTRNLPMILAGGGFKHAGHLDLGTKDNTPMCNLFVQMLQKLGMETASFGSSTSTSVPGLM